MATGPSASEITVRAINVQLAGALKTAALALVGTRRGFRRCRPKCPQARVKSVRDDVICLAGRVLVDDRRVHAVAINVMVEAATVAHAKAEGSTKASSDDDSSKDEEDGALGLVG